MSRYLNGLKGLEKMMGETAAAKKKRLERNREIRDRQWREINRLWFERYRNVYGHGALPDGETWTKVEIKIVKDMLKKYGLDTLTKMVDELWEKWVKDRKRGAPSVKYMRSMADSLEKMATMNDPNSEARRR